MGTVHIDITLVASPETGVFGLRNPNGVVKNVDVLLSVFGAKKRLSRGARWILLYPVHKFSFRLLSP
jgi:hypothetical protein